MTSQASPFVDRAEEHKGPPLVVLAVVFVALFLASIAFSIAMAGGEHFPSPYEPESLTGVYFAEHANAVRLSAFLQFGAAVPLGLFTAVCVSRLRFLGLTAAGTHIALFGGTAASIMSALAALMMWVITWRDVAVSSSVHALHILSFAVGGPGHVVPFGLLVAGVSVTAGIAGFVPKWLMWFGLAIATCAELSCFALIVYAGNFLLPAARVLGFVWLICVGAMLPKTRAPRADETPRAALTPAAQN